LQYKNEAIHNKDYSVVKTFKAAFGSLFLCPETVKDRTNRGENALRDIMG